MNFAYFRKSNKTLLQTIKNVKKLLPEYGWEIVGEINLEEGKLVLISKSNFVNLVLEKNKELVGFLPLSIAILKKSNEVQLGFGAPTVLKAIAQQQEIIRAATKLEAELKALVHKAGEVGEQVVKDVTLYSTHTCPYCVAEKRWLDTKGIKYDLVYIDEDQNLAEEMVRETGQMGVPVTRIRYNDGNPDFVIGFDRERLGEMLRV